MKKYIVAAMVGIFLGTVAGVAGATEAPKRNEKGCVYVRDISYTVDGSMVIRSAWRCEKKQPNKPVYGKLVVR